MQVHKKHNMIDSKKRIKIFILLIGLLLWLIILGSVILSMREYTALIDSIDIHDILPYIATMSAAIGFTTLLYLNKNEKSHSSKIDNILFYSELLKERGQILKRKRLMITKKFLLLFLTLLIKMSMMKALPTK